MHTDCDVGDINYLTVICPQQFLLISSDKGFQCVAVTIVNEKKLLFMTGLNQYYYK